MNRMYLAISKDRVSFILSIHAQQSNQTARTKIHIWMPPEIESEHDPIASKILQFGTIQGCRDGAKFHNSPLRYIFSF